MQRLGADTSFAVTKGKARDADQYYECNTVGD